MRPELEQRAPERLGIPNRHSAAPRGPPLSGRGGGRDRAISFRQATGRILIEDEQGFPFPVTHNQPTVIFWESRPSGNQGLQGADPLA